MPPGRLKFRPAVRQLMALVAITGILTTGGIHGDRSYPRLRTIG
jgi:hypothetical protein